MPRRCRHWTAIKASEIKDIARYILLPNLKEVSAVEKRQRSVREFPRKEIKPSPRLRAGWIRPEARYLVLSMTEFALDTHTVMTGARRGRIPGVKGTNLKKSIFNMASLSKGRMLYNKRQRHIAVLAILLVGASRAQGEYPCFK